MDMIDVLNFYSNDYESETAVYTCIKYIIELMFNNDGAIINVNGNFHEYSDFCNCMFSIRKLRWQPWDDWLKHVCCRRYHNKAKSKRRKQFYRYYSNQIKLYKSKSTREKTKRY